MTGNGGTVGIGDHVRAVPLQNGWLWARVQREAGRGLI